MAKTIGFPRVDLVGGTLDIFPINFLFKDVVTINLALDLPTQVSIEKNNSDFLRVISKNYNNTKEIKFHELSEETFFIDNEFCSDKFQELSFVFLIISYFNIKEGLTIEIDAKAPHGAGLGGSSTLGVTLYKALADHCNKSFDKLHAIKIVQKFEALILNQGMPGYQDYYPALFGGVLALKSNINEIEVEQLYTSEFEKYLMDHITLGFTGKNRSSGINNWGMYKNFFDGDKKIHLGLKEINEVAKKCYRSIINKDYEKSLELVSQEGKLRENLFSGILTKEQVCLKSDLEKIGAGLKICGAGGGGCFIIIGSNKESIRSLLDQHQMKKIDFKVQGPVA